jgi:cholinesterase
MSKIKCAVFILALLQLFIATTVSAYSTYVAFGDSLLDSGNIGRFTDGDLWIEQLAESSSGVLLDYAYGGATTGVDNPAANLPITGLQWQVSTYAPVVETLSAAETLVTVWAGGNDFLQGRESENAVFNISGVLKDLYDAGGRNFLVPNLPDIGATPRFQGNELASSWTDEFNGELASMLHQFENSYHDVNLITLDVFTLFDQFEPGSEEWASLFWTDGFHPSSLGHDLIFRTLAERLKPVPEPSTMILFGIGVAGLLRVKRS